MRGAIAGELGAGARLTRPVEDRLPAQRERFPWRTLNGSRSTGRLCLVLGAALLPLGPKT